jgi:single-stranded DNA-specific DHH superfamily exonuclease
MPSFKATINELLAMAPAIARLPRLPVKASYRLARIGDKLKPELKTFREQRMEIYKELGEADEKGNYTVPSEKLDELNSRVEQLLNVEVEIPLDPVKLSDIESAAVQIEPEVLMALGPALAE